MGFKPKDAIDPARTFRDNAVERSSDIVGKRRPHIKANRRRTGDIVHNSLDIATYAVGRPKRSSRPAG